MEKVKAAAGSLLFLICVPGVVAGLIPWMLTNWRVGDPYWTALRLTGAVFLVAAAVVLLHSFARFVVEGVGTPAPVAPTEHLVVGGLYRYVRNPMYLAVAACILGQGLILGRLLLFVYCGVFVIVVTMFVRYYEEPALTRQFGEEYEAYRDAVPRWWPRSRPWNKQTGGDDG